MLFLDERHSNDHELASREAGDLALQPRTPSQARGSRSGTSLFIFDFQRASTTGTEQNASGCNWIGLQPIIAKGDAALSDQKTYFSTKALNTAVHPSFSENMPSS